MSHTKQFSYARFLPRLFLKSGLPIHFTFFVTSHCNSKCVTCFYWDQLNKSEKELSLDEISQFTQTMGELVLLAFSGGEPFLREDLSDIAKIFYRHTKPRIMTIPTNALVQKSLEKQVPEIMDGMPRTFTTIEVSLDGPEAVHDRIRGVPGGFRKTLESFRFLKELKARYANMGLTIITVFNRLNQDHMDEMKELVLEELKPDHWAVPFVRGHPMDSSVKEASLEKYHQLKAFIESRQKKGQMSFLPFDLSSFILASEQHVSDIIMKTLQENRYQTPCYAAHLSAVMYENGNLFPCELLDRPIGNIREVHYDFPALWQSARATELRRFILKDKCFCTHECNYSINIPFNLESLPKIIGHMLAGDKK